MRIQIPFSAFSETVPEADPKLFLVIFFVNSESALKLDAQDGFSINVLSQEVGTVPVIAQSDRGESVVGQKARYFLKVIVFLLASIKLSVIDLVELKSAAHAQEYRLIYRIFPDGPCRVLHALRILLIDPSPLPHLQGCV